MDVLLQDLRFALRQLAQAPGMAAAAIATLALGIGATTAIFQAVDRVLLRPLPYADADRIATVWRTDRLAGVERDDLAPADFLDIRDRNQSFQALAIAEPYTKDFLGPDGPDRIPTWRVTEDFFAVFDVPALIGRTLQSADHAPGAEAVAVISYGTWQERFGGASDVVGRTQLLEGEATTIVGVMPPEFAYPPGREMWIPRPFEGWETANRTSTYWQAVGKLAPGVSFAVAQAELDTIATQLESEYPATNNGIGASVVPIIEHLVSGVRPALLLFSIAVTAVLLIACVNVANLLLARGADRRREFAMRAVLGADRIRVFRQLGTESLVLATLGGLLGVVVASWGLAVFDTLRPALPRADQLTLDTRAVAFASMLSLGTAIFFGLAPALGTTNSNWKLSLTLSPRSPEIGVPRFRGSLVVTQLALATMLLVSASLLARSFIRLIDVDPGYRRDNVLVATVQAWNYYPELDQRALFVEDSLARISALPGVLAAGVSSSLPLAEGIGADLSTFSIPDRPPPSPGSGEPTVHTAIVSTGYLETLSVPLRAGRLFEATDDAGSPPVVLINEEMARRSWSNEDPIGNQIDFQISGGYSTVTTAEVIGIVGDLRHAGLDQEPEPSLFLPFSQHPTGAIHFVVRSVGDPALLTRAVQEQIWEMNSTMPIDSVTTLDELVDASLRERRFSLSLLIAFALTALTLATVGTYGVLSYESARRSHEIGVRVALGASRARVIGRIVRDGLALSLVGIGIGVVLAILAARMLAAYLFGVSPLDPIAFLGTALLLIAVTALASYLPARRASRLDPIAVLGSG